MIKTFMKKQWGQGLIETVISLLIISGGVVALIQFQHNLAYGNTLSQQQAEATILATSQIEAFRNFGVINNTAGYTSYQSIASGTSTSTGSNTTYNLSWTVTTSSTTPTYKTVDITVTWNDINGGSQNIRLTSIITGLDPSLQANVI
jgi:Tfp pilus assembly protein PilV